MARIGSYEYPDTQLGTLLKTIEILIEKFNGNVQQQKNFAEALGHKTNNSGGFLRKIADLRKYGLIEARGIIATERAKKIIKPIHSNERDEAINKAVLDIKLWEELYQRIGKQIPSAEEFKIHLAEITKDRDGVTKNTDTIRNLYKDAISYLTSNEGEIVEEKGNIQKISELKTQSKQEVNKVPEDIINLQSGDTNITLPRNDSNIQILKSVLDGMVSKNKEKK